MYVQEHVQEHTGNLVAPDVTQGEPAHLGGFSTRFQKGGPGRPKGSRNKLGEVFIQALYRDFTLHGAEVLERVRVKEPAQYLKVVASILPKQLELKHDPFEGVSDEQLAMIIAAARSALGIIEGEAREIVPQITTNGGQDTEDT